MLKSKLKFKKLPLNIKNKAKKSMSNKLKIQLIEPLLRLLKLKNSKE